MGHKNYEILKLRGEGKPTACVIASTSHPLIIRIVQIALVSGVGIQSNANDSIRSCKKAFILIYFHKQLTLRSHLESILPLR